MASLAALLHRHHYLRFRSPLFLGGVARQPRSLFCSASSHSRRRESGEPKSRHKYVNNPTKYWDEFYKRRHNKFFKDRHYLEKDWGCYFSSSSPGEHDRSSADPKVVLEVGCGAGNTLLPLLAAFPNIFVHACDFSSHAISLVKGHGAFMDDRVNTFVCDLTTDDLCKSIEPASVDTVTMIFMLSAVSPLKMPLVLQNIKNVLKPSGYVLFRDYALGDFAQEQFSYKDQMVSNNFYVRGDGTCVFYFSEDSLRSLFEKNGFHTLEVGVYCKQIVNRSREGVMDRRHFMTPYDLKNSLEILLDFQHLSMSEVEQLKIIVDLLMLWAMKDISK